MNKSARIAVYIINIALCAAMLAEALFMMRGWGVFVKVVLYAVPAVSFIFGTAVFILNKPALLKSCFILTACAFAAITVIAAVTEAAGLNGLADEEKINKLTEIIKGTGRWGMLVYVFVQILQVVILPLPAAVCYIPGSLIWGAPIATLLASLGVIAGSLIAYFIGRVFGKKVVVWIAGDDTVEKYASYIGSKGKVIFLLMQILPFFPDDILCMVAGLTAMNLPFFIATIVIVRPVIIALYCFLGTGSIIPFGGWGIPVWIALFAVCIALGILSLKYQDRVEKWLVSKFRKKDKAEKAEEDKKEN